MYGILMDLEYIKVLRLVNFKNFLNMIVFIYLVLEDLVWVYGWDCSVYLLSNIGVIKKMIEMNSFFNDFIMGFGGIYIFIDFENDEIKKMDENGRVFVIVLMKLFIFIGIGKFLDGNMLVVLVDDYSFKININSKCLFKLIFIDGEEMRVFEFDKDGLIKLFIKFYCVF